MIRRIGWLICALTVATSTLSALVLDYPTALQRVLCHSAAIQLAEIDINISEAERIQAGTGLNPTLSVEVGTEEFWEGQGLGAEISPSISQEFETAGKKRKRCQVANAQVEMAVWSAEQAKWETLHHFIENFIETAIAQELVLIAEEKEKSAKIAVAHYQEIVREGKGSPLDQYKAKLTSTSVTLDLNSAKQQLESRKRKLASFWGAQEPDFEQVVYPVEDIAGIQDLRDILAHLDQRPDVKAASSATLAAYAEWELEKTQGKPNVTLSAGFTWSQECHDNGLFFGLSMPLPIFDQNRGNISRAAYAAIRKEQEEEALIQELKNGIASAYLELEKASFEVQTIKDGLLITAEEALKWTEEGYQAGKLTLLDVMDMKKEVLDQQERYYNALLDYHQKRINVIYYINTD